MLESASDSIESFCECLNQDLLGVIPIWSVGSVNCAITTFLQWLYVYVFIRLVYRLIPRNYLYILKNDIYFVDLLGFFFFLSSRVQRTRQTFQFFCLFYFCLNWHLLFISPPTIALLPPVYSLVNERDFRFYDLKLWAFH